MRESTELACRLVGSEQADRKALIAAELMEGVAGVDELPDGFAVHWSNGDPWAERVLEFIRLERQCCPFIRFELAVESNDGPVTLRLLGNDEVKQFIRTELLSTFHYLPTPNHPSAILGE